MNLNSAMPEMPAARQKPTGDPPPRRPPTPTVKREDFRDHLSTADPSGGRKWVYARKPTGRWYRRRTWVSSLLLIAMFAGPFVRVRGNPLLMLNLVERRFSILGYLFWPEDGIIFAVAMLTFFAGIMIFTTAFGRLWCGWTCPQTILMEMVFRKLEYLLEGDASAQRILNDAPASWHKFSRKLVKHGLFFAISFIIGNTLLSYLIGTEKLLAIVTDNPRQHLAGLGFMILFSGIFYAIFAHFREQACTFICPYGRFQSALLDENTMVVAYDPQRGESRAPWKRQQDVELRRQAGHGDCIDCHQCVSVCPTGIDIRNGLQMECVNCTACIDACDGVMDKLKRPKGLIRYASLNGLHTGQPLRFTARMKLYAVVLAALISLFLFLVVTRAEVEVILLRAPGALFQNAGAGRLSNLYTVKVINKSPRDLPLTFQLENRAGTIRVLGAPHFIALAEKIGVTSVFVDLDTQSLTQATTPLTIGIYTDGKRVQTITTAFIGPRH